MARKHAVELTDEQRRELDRLVNTGRESARKIARARILLKAGDGEANGAIAAALGVGVATVERVRRRFAAGGMAAAVERRPQPPRPGKRVLDGAAEARLITLACSRPPDGYGHWTLDLLADRLVRLNVVPAVSGDTVGRVLKGSSGSRVGSFGRFQMGSRPLVRIFRRRYCSSRSP
jgi:transposase